jgi:hypothetical protein
LACFYKTGYEIKIKKRDTQQKIQITKVKTSK